MNTLLAVAALSLLSFNVHAASTPAWDGFWEAENTGRFNDDVDHDLPCEYVRVSLKVVDDTLEEYFTARCDTGLWEDSLTFEIHAGRPGKGQELWLDGEKVGTMTATAIDYELTQPEENYVFRQRLERDARHKGGLKYHDETMQNLYRSRIDAELPPLPDSI